MTAALVRGTRRAVRLWLLMVVPFVVTVEVVGPVLTLN